MRFEANAASGLLGNSRMKVAEIGRIGAFFDGCPTKIFEEAGCRQGVRAVWVGLQISPQVVLVLRRLDAVPHKRLDATVSEAGVHAIWIAGEIASVILGAVAALDTFPEHDFSLSWRDRSRLCARWRRNNGIWVRLSGKLATGFGDGSANRLLLFVRRPSQGHLKHADGVVVKLLRGVAAGGGDVRLPAVLIQRDRLLARSDGLLRLLFGNQGPRLAIMAS